MQEYLLALLITGLLYWYFNIYNKNKCIIIDRNCDGMKCIKQKI
jgi:hypothetical protein